MSIGKKNCYTCQKCGGRTTTLDIDEGVTPFAIQCKAKEGCKGMMYSCFYQIDQTIPVNYVWYMPKDLQGFNQYTLEHIRKGGLVMRKATSEEMWRYIVRNYQPKGRAR